MKYQALTPNPSIWIFQNKQNSAFTSHAKDNSEMIIMIMPTFFLFGTEHT